jgi:hypothetical protein
LLILRFLAYLSRLLKRKIMNKLTMIYMTYYAFLNSCLVNQAARISASDLVTLAVESIDAVGTLAGPFRALLRSSFFGLLFRHSGCTTSLSIFAARLHCSGGVRVVVSG